MGTPTSHFDSVFSICERRFSTDSPEVLILIKVKSVKRRVVRGARIPNPDADKESLNTTQLRSQRLCDPAIETINLNGSSFFARDWQRLLAWTWHKLDAVRVLV